MPKTKTRKTRMDGSFSAYLRRQIQDRGLTAYRLAKDSGISVDSARRFMSGERGLRTETVDKVCKALGIVFV